MRAKEDSTLKFSKYFYNQLINLPPYTNKLIWIKEQNVNARIINNVLILAVSAKNLDLIKTLSKIPALDFNAAICTASSIGQPEIVEFLSKIEGVNLGANNNQAICLAAENGHAQIVKFLCGKPGVNPGAKNNTPIATASANGHLETVKILCSQPKVNVTAKSHLAITKAKENKKEKVVDFLASLPCYNPFTKGINANQQQALIKLLTKLGLEQHIVAHQVKSNRHLGFLFFDKMSSMDCLVPDVKKIIAQYALDLDNKSIGLK